MSDLSWNLSFLRFGLHVVLPKDHPIQDMARLADKPGQDPLPVWREVAALPWDVVEAVIFAVQKEHALWHFEFGNLH